MRYIRYLLIAIFALALVTVALANRHVVGVQLLPPELAGLSGLHASIELPMFLIILASIAAGFLVGYVWEWLREASQRSSAARTAREKRRLEREVTKLKGEKHKGKDDVLALLDEAG